MKFVFFSRLIADDTDATLDYSFHSVGKFLTNDFI